MIKAGDKYILEIVGVDTYEKFDNYGGVELVTFCRTNMDMGFTQEDIEKLEKYEKLPSVPLEVEHEMAYEKGLNDAWKAARKIMCDKDINARFNTIFGQMTWDDKSNIFVKHTATEAISKIKAYEKTKK